VKGSQAGFPGTFHVLWGVVDEQRLGHIESGIVTDKPEDIRVGFAQVDFVRIVGFFEKHIHILNAKPLVKSTKIVPEVGLVCIAQQVGVVFLLHVYQVMEMLPGEASQHGVPGADDIVASDACRKVLFYLAEKFILANPPGVELIKDIGLAELVEILVEIVDAQLVESIPYTVEFYVDDHSAEIEDDVFYAIK